MSPDDRPGEQDPDSALDQKFSQLLALLRAAGSAALAFSGGVDSTFLLRAMKLSGMPFLAVTAVSPTMPGADYQKALSAAAAEGVRHMVIRTDELANEKFVRNDPDRCFHCKDELFSRLGQIAEQNQLTCLFDGTNTDDLQDYRPGKRAAQQHGVRSPLAECGFTKQEIRAISKKLGLSTWDEPASPCLSSRFPYGFRITAPALKRVEEAEEFLKSLGLRLVRVRDHGEIARIEVSDADMLRLVEPDTRLLITERFRLLGYLFISLDLEGYKTGSLNRVLEPQR